MCQMEKVKSMLPDDVGGEELYVFEAMAILERLASKGELVAERLSSKFQFAHVDEVLAELDEQGGEEKVDKQEKLDDMATAARQAYPILRLTAKLRQLQCAMDGVPKDSYKGVWTTIRRELGNHETTMEQLLSAVALVDDMDVLARVGEGVVAVEKMMEVVGRCNSIEVDGVAKKLDEDILHSVPASLRVNTRNTLAQAECAAAGARAEWRLMTSHLPADQLPEEIQKTETKCKRMFDDVMMVQKRHAVDVMRLDEDVAAVLPETLRQSVGDDLLACVKVLVQLRDQATSGRMAVAQLSESEAEESAGVSLAEETLAEEAEPPAQGQENAAANAAVAAGMAEGLMQMTPLFEKVTEVLDALKDRFTGVDSTISSSKAEVGKVAAEPAPWKLLTQGVREVLSSAGELEAQLGTAQEQLREEATIAHALREDLEAAAEKVRPLQRALKEKEERLAEATIQSETARKDYDVIKDALDTLKGDLKNAEEENIKLQRKAGIGRRVGGAAVSSSPARSAAGTPRTPAPGDSGAELTAEQLEEQQAEVQAMAAAVTRLREAKQRAEKARAQQRLGWLKHSLPGADRRVGDGRQDKVSWRTPASSERVSQCSAELSQALQRTRKAQANMKVVDLAQKTEGGPGSLQLLSSANLQLGQLSAQCTAASTNGQSCLTEARRGVSERAIHAFLRDGPAADSKPAIGRLQIPGTSGAGVAKAVVLSAGELHAIHSVALRV